jgi:zinc transporter ZupT
MGIALVATLAALAGAVIGIFWTATGSSTRVMVPFGGGLLVGIAAFGLLPEMITEIGWLDGLLLAVAGYLFLLLVNRYIYPVCPSCGHDHNHEICLSALHGFAAPLISAAALHSFLDGWSIVTAQHATAVGVRVALPVAMALHKIPEGMALGAIMRAAVASRAAAFWWCVVGESLTLAGGAAALIVAPGLTGVWFSYPLALAAGFFFYLGFHAVHGEWKRRGGRAFMPALSGVAGVAALEQGVRTLLR